MLLSLLVSTAQSEDVVMAGCGDGVWYELLNWPGCFHLNWKSGDTKGLQLPVCWQVVYPPSAVLFEPSWTLLLLIMLDAEAESVPPCWSTLCCAILAYVSAQSQRAMLCFSFSSGRLSKFCTTWGQGSCLCFYLIIMLRFPSKFIKKSAEWVVLTSNDEARLMACKCLLDCSVLHDVEV